MTTDFGVIAKIKAQNWFKQAIPLYQKVQEENESNKNSLRSKFYKVIYKLIENEFHQSQLKDVLFTLNKNIKGWEELKQNHDFYQRMMFQANDENNPSKKYLREYYMKKNNQEVNSHKVLK